MDFLSFLSKLIWPCFFIWLIIRYAGQIKEFLETLKQWKKFSAPGGIGFERIDQNITIASPQESPTKEVPDIREDLSPEARKVLSTLWKHQKEYFPDDTRKGRWSFVVPFGNPKLGDYLMGLGETLNKGLVTIDPKNGQCLLTDAGIYYCEHNQGKLLSDWNFERWK